MTQSPLASGIRDNHQRGSVGEFIREKLQAGSAVSMVSAYFTIYAYAALQDQLNDIGHLRFLFGERASWRASILARPTSGLIASRTTPASSPIGWNKACAGVRSLDS